MKAVSFLFTMALLLASLSSPAWARTDHRRGDMFYSKNWIYDRPSVPSDRYRGQDMFKPVPLFYHRNADLFDHVKRPVYTSADMLPHLYVKTVPPHTLKMDPRPVILEQALYLHR